MKDKITISRRALMGLYVLAGIAAGIIISDITGSSLIAPAFAATGSESYTIVADANGGVWGLRVQDGYGYLKYCSANEKQCYIQP